MASSPPTLRRGSASSCRRLATESRPRASAASPAHRLDRESGRPRRRRRAGRGELRPHRRTAARVGRGRRSPSSPATSAATPSTRTISGGARSRLRGRWRRPWRRPAVRCVVQTMHWRSPAAAELRSLRRPRLPRGGRGVPWARSRSCTQAPNRPRGVPALPDPAAPASRERPDTGRPETSSRPRVSASRRPGGPKTWSRLSPLPKSSAIQLC